MLPVIKRDRLKAEYSTQGLFHLVESDFWQQIMDSDILKVCLNFVEPYSIPRLVKSLACPRQE